MKTPPLKSLLLRDPFHAVRDLRECADLWRSWAEWYSHWGFSWHAEILLDLLTLWEDYLTLMEPLWDVYMAPLVVTLEVLGLPVDSPTKFAR
jgi:hypothetical protein